MIDFKDIYSNLNLYLIDDSVYAGLALISTAVLGVGALFYFGNKYCLKDLEKDKVKDLEKKVEK